MKNKLSSSVGFTIILFCILCFIILILSYISAEKIKKSEQVRELELVSSVIDVKFDNNPTFEKMKMFSKESGEYFDIYPVRLNGVVNCVVVKVINHKGYGGYLEVLVAFFMDGTISGYRVITHNETIGLGSQIVDEDFAKQFKFLHPERNNIKIKKDGGDIDAITSATISSRAISTSLQMGYNAYQKFLVGQ